MTSANTEQLDGAQADSGRPPLPVTVHARSGLPRWGTVLAVTAFVLALWQTAVWSRKAALDDLRAHGAQSLTLFINNLTSELEKFEFLPQILARNEKIARLLRNPGNPALVGEVNAYLERVNNIIRASDTYVMDLDGLTIAASNWRSDTPFLGQNFGFRPYFQSAIDGETGRYFALGTTSKRRGYYFAYPIIDGGSTQGVIVVKVSLDHIETAWAQSDEEIIVTDTSGVVFLTTRPRWMFKTLRPLDDRTRKRITESRQYVDQALEALPIISESPLTGGSRLLTFRESRDNRSPGAGDANASNKTYLAQTSLLPAQNWIVHVLSDTTVANNRVTSAVALVGFGLVILGLVAVYALQRRTNLQQKLAYQQRVEETLRQARDQLEQRVAERTHELVDANQLLHQEIAERERTEHNLRNAQQELVQAAKLAALGQLAAGITHELNQPLTAIRSYSDNARLLLEQQRLPEVSANLSLVSSLTERMAQLIRHLKTFARKSDNRKSDTAVGPVIDNALALFAPRLRAQEIDLLFRPPPADITVYGDPIRLEQVLINLIKNAVDAVAGQHDKSLAIHVETQADLVEIRITDNGPGIPDTHLPRVFDPFFTTKEIGDGLGLGLSISYGIVSDMGGNIRARNREGGGAEFVVTLPRTQTAHAAATAV